MSALPPYSSDADRRFFASLSKLPSCSVFLRVKCMLRARDASWCEEERSALLPLRQEGKTPREIAEYLNRPVTEVYRELIKQGRKAMEDGVSFDLTMHTFGFTHVTYNAFYDYYIVATDQSPKVIQSRFDEIRVLLDELEQNTHDHRTDNIRMELKNAIDRLP